MKKLFFLLSLTLAAQAPINRNVVLSWGASTTPGVTGYNVYRAFQNTTAFTVLNTTPISGLQYTDTTAVIGSVYLYQITSLTPACTSTTSPTTPCGESLPSAQAIVPVPPRPASAIGGIIGLVP